LVLAYAKQKKYGNSSDKLRHFRAVVYLVELVLMNKHRVVELVCTVTKMSAGQKMVQSAYSCRNTEY